jgi:amino acid adenylation domain-containing protein
MRKSRVREQETPMTDNAADKAAALRRAVDELSPERRALLSLRLASRRAAAQEAVTARPREAGVNRFPASPGQERLYYRQELTPDSTTYLLPFLARIKGRPRVDALRIALTRAVDRHEVLRTGFELTPDLGLTQVAYPAAAVPVDLLTDEIHADDLPDRFAELTSQPFDLSAPPLLRARLWRLRGTGATEEWVFALGVHHIVVDGWSIGLLVNEMIETYSAIAQDRTPQRAPLAVQYADFAHWQRERLTSPAADRHLAHWRATLQDAHPLTLPTDRPRQAQRPQGYDSVALPLSPRAVTRLDVVAHSVEATHFMVLLAAFVVVLRRWSGQDDVLVGTPVAGRDRPELEQLVGFFVNTIPLRVRTAEAATFRELVRLTRAACLDAYQHQDAPFERIMQGVDGERRGGTASLLTVMLALRNVPAGRVRLPELDIEVQDLPTAGTDFDLTVEFAPAPDGGLSGWLIYSRDLFDQDTAERIAVALREVLDAAIADPDTALRDLPVMPATSRQTLSEFGVSTEPGCPDRPLLDWFTDHVHATPDATAVVAGTDTLTFAELSDRADQLVRRLRQHGAGPEDRVVVCLPRGLDLVASLLAVLRAGAVFVPLEVDHPDERIGQLITDAAPKLVLSDSATAARLPVPDPVLVDDRDAEPDRTDLADVPVFPDNAAYVLYTSGSTGQPKGVVITRQALANRVRGMCTVFGFDQRDVVLHKTPVSADTAMWELLVSLFSGGLLVLADPGKQSHPGHLFDLMSRHRVTTCFYVPSALRRVLEVPGFAAAARTLRLMICAGEELPAPLCEQVLEAAPHIALYNSYGPTEATINVSEYQARTPVPTPVPIGGPVPGAEMYVLDELFRVQPVGVPGDLFAGGVQVTRGYLDRPGLTAQACVPHPFRRGERLYRTGDRARWRPDGVLEFLGRADQQVKILGFRVEPGEVESALRGHPGVAEATVVAEATAQGDLGLVVYVTPRVPGRLSVHSLRGHLGRLLPRPMVPARFVQLDAFPLTGYGKVDRAALSDAVGLTLSDMPHVPPSDELETVLVEVWAQVLDTAGIGVHDDFFALGGHSLLATVVVSQVRELFRIELPLHFFVETPNVADLAGLVRAQGRRDGVDVDRVAQLVLQVQHMSSTDVAELLGD